MSLFSSTPFSFTNSLVSSASTFTPFPPATPAPEEASADESCMTLYVGNLDQRVSESLLTQFFEGPVGIIRNIKLIPEKYGHNKYAFIEYDTKESALAALISNQGKNLFDRELKVNWAFGVHSKEDTSSHFHIFVGDLSSEVTDQILALAFGKFPSLSEARVMWDTSSGKSRGYGFVAFREKADAEAAIGLMNGVWIGSRPVRVNWANHKTNPSSLSISNFETISSQTTSDNTTVYVGNLAPSTTPAQLMPIFQSIGVVIDLRIHSDRGFAFVTFATHEAATMAIVSLHGSMLTGRPIKVSWGKDRLPNGLPNSLAALSSVNFSPSMPSIAGHITPPAHAAFTPLSSPFSSLFPSPKPQK